MNRRTPPPLAHDANHAGLLQNLAGDVEGQVVGVDDAADKGEVSGEEGVVELVRDAEGESLFTHATRFRAQLEA